MKFWIRSHEYYRSYIRMKLYNKLSWVNLAAKTALNYLYPFLSFSVHNFCARTDGQTFFEKFSFSSWSRIYIHVYSYLKYFSNFTPLWPKLVYLFSILEIGMKIIDNYMKENEMKFTKLINNRMAYILPWQYYPYFIPIIILKTQLPSF